MRALVAVLLLTLSLPAAAAIDAPVVPAAQARYDVGGFTCVTTTTAHPLAPGAPVLGGFTINRNDCALFLPEGDIFLEVVDDFGAIEAIYHLEDLAGAPCSRPASTSGGVARFTTEGECRIAVVTLPGDAISGFINAFA